jgi:hypothetical protein
MTTTPPCAACGHPLVAHQVTFDQAGRVVARGARADGTRLTCALAPAFQRPLTFRWAEGTMTGEVGYYGCWLALVPQSIALGNPHGGNWYVGGVRVFRQGDLPYEARRENQPDQEGERADVATLDEAMAQVERWARERYDAPREGQ